MLNPRLAFFKPTTLLGRAISFLTRSPYCHVGLLIDTGKAIVLVEALDQGLTITTRWATPGRVVELEIYPAWALAWVEKNLGMPYGYGDLIGDLQDILHLGGHGDRRGWTCSESVAHFLKDAYNGNKWVPPPATGGGEVLGVESHKVKPSDLNRWFH
jgi:hypothetical protein